MRDEIRSERPRHTTVKQHSHAAGRNNIFRAYSSTATACARVTSGKQSRYSSRLSPLSRLVNKHSTGTRVPSKHGAPLIRSGSAQTGSPGGILKGLCMGNRLSDKGRLRQRAMLRLEYDRDQRLPRAIHLTFRLYSSRGRKTSPASGAWRLPPPPRRSISAGRLQRRLSVSLGQKISIMAVRSMTHW